MIHPPLCGFSNPPHTCSPTLHPPTSPQQHPNQTTLYTPPSTHRMHSNFCTTSQTHSHSTKAPYYASSAFLVPRGSPSPQIPYVQSFTQHMHFNIGPLGCLCPMGLCCTLWMCGWHWVGVWWRWGTLPGVLMFVLGRCSGGVFWGGYACVGWG